MCNVRITLQKCFSACINKFVFAINGQQNTWGCGQHSSGSERTLVDTVMNLQISWRTRQVPTSHERFCSMELISWIKWAKPRRKICAPHWNRRFSSYLCRRNKTVRPLKYWRIPFQLLVLSRALKSIFVLLWASIPCRVELPIGGYCYSQRAASLWQKEGAQAPWGR